MENKHITELSEYKIATPKVNILRRQSANDKEREYLKELLCSVNRKTTLPIVEMTYGDKQPTDSSKNWGIDNRAALSPIRIVQAFSPQHVSAINTRGRDFCSFDKKKNQDYDDLSVVGSVVNNKDWVSMILYNSSLIRTLESKEGQSNSRSKIGKSVPKTRYGRQRVFRGRCFGSPQSLEPLKSSANVSKKLFNACF